MTEAKTEAPPAGPEEKAGAAAPVTNRPETVWQPIAALRDEMDRLFENFRRGLVGARMPEPRWPWRLEASLGTVAPAVDIVENDQEYRVVVELPGMNAEDVELSVADNLLTVKGEKKEEKEEKAENYYVSERRFGAFQRSFQLPQGVDRDKIDASFNKGILTVVMPKNSEAASRQKKIEIKQSA